jgi:ClpP class serine protease
LFPGGEVSGCFDLVDAIYAIRGKKPIWGILNEYAYSAGYAIASACDYVTVPRTGGVGSIGVITMHVDMSKAIDSAGLKSPLSITENIKLMVHQSYHWHLMRLNATKKKLIQWVSYS